MNLIINLTIKIKFKLKATNPNKINFKEKINFTRVIQTY